MQSTGQTSTQELSLVPMHGSLITYATDARTSDRFFQREWSKAIIICLVVVCKLAETMGVRAVLDPGAKPERGSQRPGRRPSTGDNGSPAGRSYSRSG